MIHLHQTPLKRFESGVKESVVTKTPTMKTEGLQLSEQHHETDDGEEVCDSIWFITNMNA